MAALQEHLVGGMLSQLTSMDFVKQTSDMNLDFNFEHVDAAIEGTFNMASISE